MNKLNVGIFISGAGTTLRAVNEAINNNILQMNIDFVVTNKSQENSSEITEYCTNNNLNLIHRPFDFQINERSSYLANLTEILSQYGSNLYLFLGWNMIVGEQFISSSPRILNLHPSLPNSFIGSDCVRKAFDAYQRGEITFTGSMVHQVTPELDRGEVYGTIRVNINENDSYEDLHNRVKNYEKGLVVSVLQNEITKHNQALVESSSNEDYVGKVRTVSDIGYGHLLMTASDRLSAFDRHICDVPNKGSVLNHMSAWWFKNTSHIIDNHYVYSNDKYMIVNKCNPIKLEFVVRGYMTGSTSTSIWPMYNSGNRNMYGITFREGYSKNEKLDENIITPTTKGVHDHPITRSEIIEQGYLSEEQYDYIALKALELFSYGQMVASDRGLILVDTKYEFGFHNGKIILIDELHTCDSSRYWRKSTYEERFNSGSEPEKLDKDCVRDFVKKNCDPYNDELPDIPNELIENVSNVYMNYYNIFVNNEMSSSITLENILGNLENILRNRVVIISGSVSDETHCKKIEDNLRSKNIISNTYYCSAHKNTRGVLDILSKYENSSQNIVYVTVAGMSNALSGVVSCNTRFPVIACPPFKDKMDMFTNINSSLQCPSNVPVMTILSPLNVAIATNKIFALN